MRTKVTGSKRKKKNILYSTLPDSKLASDDGGDWVMVPDEPAIAQSDEGSPKLQEDAANVEQAKLPSGSISMDETVTGKLHYELN